MVPLSWLLPNSRSIEARGRLFIKPGQDIYEGQVIGIHQRAGDLAVNACKRKAATNIRRCFVVRMGDTAFVPTVQCTFVFIMPPGDAANGNLVG